MCGVCVSVHVCVGVITTALQSEAVIKVQSDRGDLRRRMRDMEQKLQHERQDHRDINSGTVETGHESTISLSFNNLKQCVDPSGSEDKGRVCQG